MSAAVKLQIPQSPERRLLTLQGIVTPPELGSQIDGIDPGQAIIVFYGPPKGGKTFTVCDLTMHAAHGLPTWHGHAIHEKLRVAYLAGEGVSGPKIRLKAWLEHHDSVTEPGEFRAYPYALSLPTEASNLVAMLVLRATADVLVQIGKDENNNELVGFQVINARDMPAMESALPLRLVTHDTEWKDKRDKPLVSCVVEAAEEPVHLPGRGKTGVGRRTNQNPLRTSHARQG